MGCGHLDALVALTVAGAPGFAHDTLRAVASAIASSCWPLFYYLLWMVLLDAGEDNGVGPVPTFAWGWFVLNVVLVLAAPVAFLFARQVDEDRVPNVGVRDRFPSCRKQEAAIA